MWLLALVVGVAFYIITSHRVIATRVASPHTTTATALGRYLACARAWLA